MSFLFEYKNKEPNFRICVSRIGTSNYCLKTTTYNIQQKTQHHKRKNKIKISFKKRSENIYFR